LYDTIYPTGKGAPQEGIVSPILRPLTFLPASKPRTPGVSVILTDWLSKIDALCSGSLHMQFSALFSVQHSYVPNSIKSPKTEIVVTVFYGGNSCGNIRHAQPEKQIIDGVHYFLIGMKALSTSIL
jgi:hypothetical protein